VLLFVAGPNYEYIGHLWLACSFLDVSCIAWLYSIVELTLGLLTSVASATVLCILTYRWSWGHISFRVSLHRLLCWVFKLTVYYEIFMVGYRHILVVPTTFHWTPLTTSSSPVMLLLIARRNTINLLSWVIITPIRLAVVVMYQRALWGLDKPQYHLFVDGLFDVVKCYLMNWIPMPRVSF
jgi:hypothetical protein